MSGLLLVPPFRSECYFCVSEPTNLLPWEAGISAERPYGAKKSLQRGWQADKAELPTSP